MVGYHEISINGSDIKSTESDLITTFGKPNSISQPGIDAGALSTEWNGVKVIL
jgi:hypothetical protein